MTTRLLVGDVFERMAELPDASFDLIVTSPPFLALRSYLPDGHPQKHLEIGSEPTPADYLDTLLALTAEWRRLLAPHGSIAIELGDTYAGSGGAGGDYDPGGIRSGQNKAAGSAKYKRIVGQGFIDSDGRANPRGVRALPGGYAGGGAGWPLEKSLTGIPTLYAWSLAYGRNLLTGQESPAGQWRIRNLKPWVRSNPPVGALGDKERPATSYITVACTGRDRWFDLDAVRTQATTKPQRRFSEVPRTVAGQPAQLSGGLRDEPGLDGSGGAPPLDWWHPIDALIDDELGQRAGKGANRRTAKGVDSTDRSGKSADRGGNWGSLPELGETNGSVGANGTHIRRRLETAGYLTPQDFHDISPKGYAGAHYAVWPPELVRQLIDEMCPRRVCTVCGVPSRRIVEHLGEERRPDPPSLEYFANALTVAMRQAGVSHRDVAESLGIDEAMVRHYLGKTGKVNHQLPSIEAWRQLDRLLPFKEATRHRMRTVSADYETVDRGARNVPGRLSGGPQIGDLPKRTPTGWSDCECGKGPCQYCGTDMQRNQHGDWCCEPCGRITNHWRPGRILDPFVGSGTTLAVASGMGRDSVGIDLDERNAVLCQERVGMFLEVDYPTREVPA